MVPRLSQAFSLGQVPHVNPFTATQGERTYRVSLRLHLCSEVGLRSRFVGAPRALRTRQEGEVSLKSGLSKKPRVHPEKPSSKCMRSRLNSPYNCVNLTFETSSGRQG